MDLSPQIICTLCLETLRGGEDLSIVATLCGHVFHKECLSSWFETLSPHFDFSHLPKDEMLKGNCPVCSKPQWFRRCLKIYLSQDDEESTYVKKYIEQLKQERDEATAKLKSIEEKMQIQQLTSRVRSKLQSTKTEPANSSTVAVTKPPQSRKRMGLPDVDMPQVKSKPALTMTLRSASKHQLTSVATATPPRASNVNRTSSISQRSVPYAAPTVKRTFSISQRPAPQTVPIVKRDFSISQRPAPQTASTVKRSSSIVQRQAPQPTSTVNRTSSISQRPAPQPTSTVKRTASISQRPAPQPTSTVKRTASISQRPAPQTTSTVKRLAQRAIRTGH